MQSQILRINRRTVLKTAGAATAVGISQPFVLYDAHAQTAVPVRLTTGLKLANYGPIYVAQRAGLFEKQGLSLAADVGGSVNEPVAIALSGRGQFAATGTGMAMNSTAARGLQGQEGGEPAVPIEHRDVAYLCDEEVRRLRREVLGCRIC